MKNFYVADTHYYHKNIIKYEDRPFKTVEEMNEYMIYKHNEKVSKEDNVYFIGDFALATPDQTTDILLRLNGKKHLVYGNHDKVVKQNKLVQAGFVWCRDYAVVYEGEIPVILFHYPIQVWDRKHHGSIHLYGHIHSNKDNHHPMVNNLENAYNVGVDVTNFAPVTLEEILKISKLIKK